MDDRIRAMGYAVGDVLGPLAPASMTRPTHTTGWLYGVLSLAGAAGISYVFLRRYEKKLGQLVDHARAERRQVSVRRSVPASVVDRKPSDIAAISSAAHGAGADGSPDPTERHRKATETAGGSL